MMPSLRKPSRRILLAAAISTAAFALVLWCPGTPSRRTGQALSAKQPPEGLQGLAKLPSLQTLHRAGELPSDTSMRRDLFLFEAPRPVTVVHPPAQAVQVPEPPAQDPDRVLALASAPRGLRYLGFLRGAPAGLLGAFMAGEEPLTLQPGSEQNGWRLEGVLEEAATFRHQRFPDLTITLHAKGDT